MRLEPINVLQRLHLYHPPLHRKIYGALGGVQRSDRTPLARMIRCPFQDGQHPGATRCRHNRARCCRGDDGGLRPHAGGSGPAASRSLVVYRRKEDSNKLTKHLKLCRFFHVVIWRAPRNVPTSCRFPADARFLRKCVKARTIWFQARRSAYPKTFRLLEEVSGRLRMMPSAFHPRADASHRLLCSRSAPHSIHHRLR
jgi:hypothetical protein